MNVKQKIKQNQPLIWLFCLLIVFLIAMYIIQSNQPKQYHPYTSKSPAPTGTKSLYTYVNNHYDSVNRWSQSPEKLSTTVTDQLLIIIEPLRTMTSEEINHYEQFIRAGNTVLLLTNTPMSLFDMEYSNEISDEYKMYDANGKAYDIKEISAYRFNVDENEQEEKIFEDENGQALAIKKSIGDGEVYVFSSVDFLMNQFILEEDHIPIIIHTLNQLDVESVYFDESIYFEPTTFSQFEPYPKWFLLLMIQLIILTLLWLLLKGKRFGPIQTVREDAVRFSDESIRAVANWYLRSRQYHDSLNIQAAYLKNMCMEKWGVSTNKEWSEYKHLVKEKRITIKGLDIDAFFDEIGHVLRKEKMSKQEYLLWSKKIDQVKREVEQ